MATHVGNVSFYMGPHTLAPNLDNLEQVIVDFIDGAQSRLAIAVQELETRPIAEAILRAEIERGVQVQLVLEADYLVSDSRPATVAEAFEPGGPKEVNRQLAAALLRSTVWLKWSQKTGQSAKMYPKPLKGYENGEAPEL